jgi:hypothetical protein
MGVVAERQESLCFTEFLAFMIDGDMSAAEVISRMMAVDKPRAVWALNVLDERGIRGRGIWDIFTRYGCRVEAVFSGLRNGK